MKLIEIDPTGPPFWFLCYRCNEHCKSTGGAYADLDGEAFRAYYCTACRQEIEAEERSVKA